MNDPESQFKKSQIDPSSTNYLCRDIQRGDYCVINGRPCRIWEKYLSKNDMKVLIRGVDMMTNEKFEELLPATQRIEQPIVKWKDYTVADIEADGYLLLVEEDGSTREDLKLPNEDVLTESIKQMFSDGKDISVKVISCVGYEQIISVEEN